MALKAKFPGTCARTGRRYEAGDWIEGGRGSWSLVDPPDAGGRSTAPPVSTVATKQTATGETLFSVDLTEEKDVAPSTEKPHVPSALQAAIYEEGVRGTCDILVNAMAGSGKTKTLEELTRRLPPEVRARTRMFAFNTHIAEELQHRQKQGQIPAEVTISTLHSFGYQILTQELRPTTGRNYTLPTKYRRLNDYFWAPFDPGPGVEDEELKAAKKASLRLAELSMLTCTFNPPTLGRGTGGRSGYSKADDLYALIGEHGIVVPDRYEEEVLNAADQIVIWGMEGLPQPDKDGKTYHPREHISYSDMIWLPLALWLPIPVSSMILVDEAQDLNTCQRRLAIKAKGPNGRAVWVGDPNQAIYMFLGADPASYWKIKEETGAIEMPLSICYRCDRAIIRYAQQLVPGIQARPDAGPGEVLHATNDELVARVLRHYRNPETAKDRFMLLCRVNAPLIATAFDLIRQGVPAKVIGRDIGAQLVQTVEEITQLAGFSWDRFATHAEHYRRNQSRALEGKEELEMALAAMHDRVDSVLAIVDGVVADQSFEILDLLDRGEDLEAIKRYVDRLFVKSPTVVTLSSIHKAKGLQAPVVGILHHELIPHPKASTETELAQEDNLAYVAATRAERTLILATDPLD